MKLIFEDIIKQMTLEEKASLMSGKDFWQTQNIDRLNIETIFLARFFLKVSLAAIMSIVSSITDPPPAKDATTYDPFLLALGDTYVFILARVASLLL